MKIDELDLSIRAYNVLWRAGIHTTDVLRTKSETDLMALRGMGVRCCEEILYKMSMLKESKLDQIRGMTIDELAKEMVSADFCLVCDCFKNGSCVATAMYPGRPLGASCTEAAKKYLGMPVGGVLP